MRQAAAEGDSTGTAGMILKGQGMKIRHPGRGRGGIMFYAAGGCKCQNEMLYSVLYGFTSGGGRGFLTVAAFDQATFRDPAQCSNLSSGSIIFRSGALSAIWPVSVLGCW